MKILKILSILTIAGLFFTSCLNTKKENTTTDETEVMEVEETNDTLIVMDEKASSNIIEVTVANVSFSTLEAAIKAADLVEPLSGEGPFTVFAPTNEAFSKLKDGTLETLLKEENKAKLSDILTYHVVSGRYDANAVTEAIKKNNGKFKVTTLNGGTIELSLRDGDVILTDSKGTTSIVVIPNVAASNGVIHAIDTVLMPK